jgi:hypothetical protein
MKNHTAFIAIVGLILTGSIQAGIALDTAVSSDSILMSSASGFGEYVGNSHYAEENELSAQEEKYLKSPLCLSEFIPESHRPEVAFNIDWATDDEILYLFDETANAKWLDEFVNLDLDPVFGSANNRVNRDAYQSETIYGFNDRISSKQSSNIITFYSVTTGGARTL